MERMKIGENFLGLLNLMSLILIRLPPMKKMEQQRRNPRRGFSSPLQVLDLSPNQGA
ncbi:hypothetical protein A2U01_0117337, partial [Trifolium medium]|nr:hypothetical protein [Trifolium medium]